MSALVYKARKEAGSLWEIKPGAIYLIGQNLSDVVFLLTYSTEKALVVTKAIQTYTLSAQCANYDGPKVLLYLGKWFAFAHFPLIRENHNGQYVGNYRLSYI